MAAANKEPFPTKQLIIVGICRFSEPLAFNSILAYSYEMVMDLGIPEKDAAFYSGLLVSAYAVAEAITAVGWGAISDVYGRKPVALIGLGGVALSSLVFGLAPTYWVALCARLLGGALNGNVAIMQTMVQEMVKNPEHEPKAYATQPFVWTLGSIIGSAMGGFLAQPAVYYPNVFSPDGIFARYPYLLPNLVAAIGIILAIIQGIIFLEETKPADAPEPAEEEEEVIDERTPLHRSRPRNSTIGSISRGSQFRDRSNSVFSALRESVREVRKRPSFMEDSMPMPFDQRFDIRRSSFGTMHSIKLPHEVTRPIIPRSVREEAPQRRTFNYTVIMITLCLVIMAYHQMAFTAIFPVYILDPPVKKGIDLVGGLGYSLHDVGTYLAVNGFVALFIQGVIFPAFVESIGIWYSFVSMIVLYPTCFVFLPFLSSWPAALISPGIYLAMFLQAFYGIIAFPCALILLKNATPNPLKLGRVNGLAMSACCLARTVSPPLIGLIYSAGGNAAAWFSLMAVAVIGAIQIYWVPNELPSTKVEVESGLKSAVHTLQHRPSISNSVAVED